MVTNQTIVLSSRNKQVKANSEQNKSNQVVTQAPVPTPTPTPAPVEKKCGTGYFLYNGLCIKCPTGSTWDG